MPSTFGEFADLRMAGYALAVAVTTSLPSNSAIPIPGRQCFLTTGIGLGVSLIVILATILLLAGSPNPTTPASNDPLARPAPAPTPPGRDGRINIACRSRQGSLHVGQ
jgi:hypothetical protein